MRSKATHRKRVSVETTHSLPLYVPDSADTNDNPDDRPPDYSDSAEEADEDTDSSESSAYVPPPPPSSFSLSPRRRRLPAQQTYRRRQFKNSNSSSTDPYLDSLLARSVHALEMSNTLLQSSMSTQTALSTIFADSPVDEVLESSARGLSMRIERRDTRPKWADDLAEISRGVDGLFAETKEASDSGLNVSCSLPTASSTIKEAQRHKRRPSMLELDQRDGLHLSYQERSDLVAPPPCAVTQYVGSNAGFDSNLFYMPSTLGARASSSSLNLPLHAPLSSPKITGKLSEPATPAYNMLSSFVNRRPSSTSSTPAVLTSPLPALPNFFSNISRRNSSPSSSRRRQITEQPSPSPSPSSKSKSKAKSPSTTRASSHDRSPNPLTPKQIHTSLPHYRPMTPPAEESSSSSDGCPAKRTVLSLRKILDEQPPPLPAQVKRLRAPAFLPRTPAPAAEAGTSTATASISRLYTKGKHISSTRAASPPRQSAMKQPPSQPLTPTSPSSVRSPTTSKKPTILNIHVPDLLRVRNWSTTSLRSLSGSSAPSSGRSTPTSRRISFAELPEAYRGNTSARFKERERRRRERRGKGGGSRGGDECSDGKREGEGEGGWWGSWLLGGGGGGNGVGGMRGEERIEERLGRSWGGRMPGAPTGFGPAAMDDWAI